MRRLRNDDLPKASVSVLLNSAKGRLTESLVMVLLEHAGYRVTRFGIEQSLDEIRYLRGPHLADLHLSKHLWSMPDLLVVDIDMPDVMPLEVKFRKRFDPPTARAIAGALRHQRNSWPDAWAILVVAVPPEGVRGNAYQDHVRMVGPQDLDTLSLPLSPREVWMKLPTLGSVFSRVHETPEFHAEVDRLLPVLRSLAEV